MSGRAGRRGIDTFGLVIMLIDESIEAETVKGIVFGDADPLARRSAPHAADTAQLAPSQSRESARRPIDALHDAPSTRPPRRPHTATRVRATVRGMPRAVPPATLAWLHVWARPGAPQLSGRNVTGGRSAPAGVTRACAAIAF